MAEDSLTKLNEAIARLDRELTLVLEAFAELGLTRCSACGRFFRSSDSASLFDGGETVCVHCVEQWWLRKRREIGVSEREILERRLVIWLVNGHDARVVQQPIQVSSATLPIVVGCTTCGGAGTVTGRSCPTCDGRGTLWLIVSHLHGRTTGKQPDAQVSLE